MSHRLTCLEHIERSEKERIKEIVLLKANRKTKKKRMNAASNTINFYWFESQNADNESFRILEIINVSIKDFMQLSCQLMFKGI